MMMREFGVPWFAGVFRLAELPACAGAPGARRMMIRALPRGDDKSPHAKSPA